MLGLQLGKPHHHAYLVADMAAAVEQLASRLGAGPFFFVENVPLENVMSRGEPAEFAHNSAFGACGDVAIELIEPTRLSPGRVAARFADPRPRVHHVAYVVPPGSAPGVRAALDDRGLPEYVSSQLGAVDTSLHDASSLFGHDIEIHIDVEGLHRFFAMVRGAADGWDGSERLRPAPR